MADRVQETRETVVRDADGGAARESVRRVTTDADDMPVSRAPRDNVDGRETAVRIVYYITGVLLSLLAIRFVLSLLGANKSNAFANIIYSITYPFVAPFFGLFGYSVEYGVARFEIETLVAMAVYALLAYGIVKLISIPRGNR